MRQTGRVRDVVILGSTGSIGTQALEVIAAAPERLRVVGLAAGGSQIGLLARQALDTGAEVVGVSRATAVQDLQLAFYAEASKRGWATGGMRLPRILAGPDAATEVARMACDVVLNGITGSDRPGADAGGARGGPHPGAGQQGVPGGRWSAGHPARPQPGQLVAVDSEHSALAQCLRGGSADEVDRLILTAQRRAVPRPDPGRARDVTPAEALAHPTWDMGRVITINSATLVNKGLEVIEAHLLYGLDVDRIDVVVHPQSIVHSMVAVRGRLDAGPGSPPDMRLPIALGAELAGTASDVGPAV